MKVTLRFVSISIYLSIHALRPTQIKDVLFLKICLKILSNGFCSHPTAAPDRRQYPFARIRGQKVKPRDFRRSWRSALEDFGDREPHHCGKILWDI